MPHIGQHESPDLTPMDFFIWGYLKANVYQAYHQIYRTLGRESPEVIALRHVHFVRHDFDAMRARDVLHFRELRLNAEQDNKY